MNNFLKGFIVHQLIKKAQGPGIRKPGVAPYPAAEFIGITIPRKALEKVYGPNLDRVISSAQANLTRYTDPQGEGFVSWVPEDLQQEISVWKSDQLPENVAGQYSHTRKTITFPKTMAMAYRKNVDKTWDIEAEIFPDRAKSLIERERALQELWKSNRYLTHLHELTHAVLEPKIDKKFLFFFPPSSRSKYTKHLFRDFPEETFGSPVELDPRLVELKRKYYQATGRIADTPEEAERAFEWLDSLYNKYYNEAFETLDKRYGADLPRDMIMSFARRYANGKLYMESQNFPDLRKFYWSYRVRPDENLSDKETKNRKRLWDIILQRMTQLVQNKPKTNWEYT